MIIDSHCHIPHKRYKESPKQIIKESIEEGIEKLITIGASLEDSRKTLETAVKFPEVHSSIGIYPDEDTDMSLEEIEEGLHKLYDEFASNIVAVGECGIDLPERKNKDFPQRSVSEQKDLFRIQIQFALDKNLPLIIHNRNGNEYIKEVLSEFYSGKLKGVAHCFVSDWDFAKEMLHFNFYISFSGVITYPSASKDLLEVVKNVPSSMFLVETDAPYLPPQGHRGEINYPKYVKITAAKIAEIKNFSYEEVEKLSYKNTCNLFNL